MRYLILFILSVFLLHAHADAQKIYLVAAGISDYPDTENDLNLPAKDAATIKWLYEQNSIVESVLLTNSQATRSNILTEIRSLFSKATPQDMVVIYFTGHGIPGYFCAYDEFLSYSELQKEMAQSQSLNKMIFADACFSGKLRETASQGNSNSSAAASLNVLLFLSSRENETSLELPTMKNGLFTAALQRGLRGGADVNRDRIITAKELFDFVSRSVKKMSKDRQHPVMWGKFDDNMPVMIWPKKK